MNLRYLRKIPGWIRGLIVFITAIIVFIGLIRKNEYLGITVLVATLWAGALLGLVYVRLAKKKGQIHQIGGKVRNYPKYKDYYQLVYAGLLVLFLISLAPLLSKPTQLFLKYAFVQDPPLAPSQLLQCYSSNAKTKILVANFAEPGSDVFGVTNLILSGLRNTMAEEDSVIVLPLARMIHEEQGSNYNQSILKDCEATMVLWGWYTTTASNALVMVNIEVVKTEKPLSFFQNASSKQGNQYIGSINQMNNFALQIEISKDVSAFATSLEGVVLMNQGKFSKAVGLFDKVIDNSAWKNQIVNQFDLYELRGLSHEASGRMNMDDTELVKAIDDYTVAIGLGSTKNYSLYTNRGTTLAYLGKYGEALDDMDRVIQSATNDTELSDGYTTMGMIYYWKGSYSDAISSLIKAISLNQENFMAYILRGLVYEKLGNEEAAKADNLEAVKLMSSQKIWTGSFEK